MILSWKEARKKMQELEDAGLLYASWAAMDPKTPLDRVKKVLCVKALDLCDSEDAISLAKEMSEKFGLDINLCARVVAYRFDKLSFADIVRVSHACGIEYKEWFDKRIIV